MNYSETRALGELRAQREMLRGMLERCEALADELDAGRCGPLQLARELTRLRLSFVAHNAFEERILRGGARELREHLEAHRSMQLALASEHTTGLATLLASIRSHLDAEDAVAESAVVTTA